jgi:hypothetical protein
MSYKCAAFAAGFFTIYFLSASNRGLVVFEKMSRNLVGGGIGSMQWS